ncbi:MAG TPA: ATP-binding protein [Candidatus Saccharimonadales bacterium]|jgi:PAS domain S-box-containing protein
MPENQSTVAGVAKAAAEFEHERLLSLINSMVDGVIAVDEHAKVDLYNGAALNILDLNSSMKDKSLSSVCKLVDADNQPVAIASLIRSAKTAFVSRDYSIGYADGSKVSLYLSIAPVHLGYGKSGKQSYVIVLRDISHEKSLEEERDEFISVVSHELRTPITIAEGNISNAQYIVDKAGGSKPIKDALHEAHQQTLFLADMINDLSTLSRAERGVLTIEPESINMHDLISDLGRVYGPEASAKGLRIYIELSPHLELLMSSKLYVREVMQNFVTNAIKYTDAGHITLAAKPHDKGVSVTIEDTGIGISKSDQEKIYDKFFRAENYQTRKTGGTGLGLYVTMKLARLLHAEITTKSELGKGSKFTIYLPNLQ